MPAPNSQMRKQAQRREGGVPNTGQGASVTAPGALPTPVQGGWGSALHRRETRLEPCTHSQWVTVIPSGSSCHLKHPCDMSACWPSRHYPVQM